MPPPKLAREAVHSEYDSSSLHFVKGMKDPNYFLPYDHVLGRSYRLISNCPTKQRKSPCGGVGVCHPPLNRQCASCRHARESPT